MGVGVSVRKNKSKNFVRIRTRPETELKFVDGLHPVHWSTPCWLCYNEKCTVDIFTVHFIILKTNKAKNIVEF